MRIERSSRGPPLGRGSPLAVLAQTLALGLAALLRTRPPRLLRPFDHVAPTVEAGRTGHRRRGSRNQGALAVVAAARGFRHRRHEATADPRVVEARQAVALETGKAGRGDDESDVGAVGVDSRDLGGSLAFGIFGDPIGDEATSTVPPFVDVAGAVDVRVNETLSGDEGDGRAVGGEIEVASQTGGNSGRSTLTVGRYAARSTGEALERLVGVVIEEELNTGTRRAFGFDRRALFGDRVGAQRLAVYGSPEDECVAVGGEPGRSDVQGPKRFAHVTDEANLPLAECVEMELPFPPFTDDQLLFREEVNMGEVIGDQDRGDVGVELRQVDVINHAGNANRAVRLFFPEIDIRVAVLIFFSRVDVPGSGLFGRAQRFVSLVIAEGDEVSAVTVRSRPDHLGVLLRGSRIDQCRLPRAAVGRPIPHVEPPGRIEAAVGIRLGVEENTGAIFARHPVAALARRCGGAGYAEVAELGVETTERFGAVRHEAQHLCAGFPIADVDELLAFTVDADRAQSISADFREAQQAMALRQQNLLVLFAIDPDQAGRPSAENSRALCVEQKAIEACGGCARYVGELAFTHLFFGRGNQRLGSPAARRPLREQGVAGSDTASGQAAPHRPERFLTIVADVAFTWDRRGFHVLVALVGAADQLDTPLAGLAEGVGWETRFLDGTSRETEHSSADRRAGRRVFADEAVAVSGGRC